MMVKLSHGHDNPNHYRFTRERRGAPPTPTPPLRPLWPFLAVGLALIAMGFVLVTKGMSPGAALGGLILMIFGLCLIGFFAHMLGRECDRKQQ
jgi:hypothetical protein